MQYSISTIGIPEFINLEPVDVSPLMRKCDIKVFYINGNHNKTWIDKDVALNIAKTLRGCPIVGYYTEEKGDFTDHGKRMIIDREGVKFECRTIPYGFVPTNAKVWFQKFEETDYKTGERVEREYMMTTGFLWAGQYSEAQKVFDDGGKGQSMEFDENTFSSTWAKKNGLEFAIVNDAVFSKLCILGDDVPPCFETASVMPSEEDTTNYTLMDDTFKSTLYSMMQDLQAYIEGGQKMTKEIENEFENAENSAEVNVPVETSSEPETDFEKKDAEGDKEEVEKDNSDSSNENKDKDEEKENEKKKYQLLEQDYTQLQSDYAELKTQYEALVEYKNQVEDSKKDALIETFYMLSDEDKADVIQNKANYTLDEIEAKLSVICVRKKVDFSLGEEKEEEKEVITTFNLSDNNIEPTPAWFSLASSIKE